MVILQYNLVNEKPVMMVMLSDEMDVMRPVLLLNLAIPVQILE